MRPKIEVRSVSKTFETRGGPVPVLEDLNFSVADGEFLGGSGRRLRQVDPPQRARGLRAPGSRRSASMTAGARARRTGMFISGLHGIEWICGIGG
jgi:hypothetical protein